ncbi:hypothetical protein [Muricoccus aerilatus]|nr:hypothetical protein [Roseomonas aerilata]
MLRPSGRRPAISAAASLPSGSDVTTLRKIIDVDMDAFYASVE